MTPLPPAHRQIAACARTFLLKENVRALPLDPAAVIRRHYTLLTFRRAAGLLGETEEEIAALCDSRDGAAWPLKKGRFCILYNDRIRVYSRTAFTLAHELGHIELGHLALPPDIRDARYAELEQQAHFFAVNLLAPAAVARACGFVDEQKLRECCGLSASAARRWAAQLPQLPPDDRADAPLLRQFSAYIRRCARR